MPWTKAGHFSQGKLIYTAAIEDLIKNTKLKGESGRRGGVIST